MVEVNIWAVALVLFALHVFGWAYNWLVDIFFDRLGPDHPWTADQVVLGTGVVLLGAAFIVGWETVAWVFLCFAAAGIPMWYGERIRCERQVQKALSKVDERIKELTDGDSA